jgi:hypothetical protein
MRNRLWASVLEGFARLRERLQKRPDQPQDHGYGADNGDDASTDSVEPASEVLHAEWAAFQTLVGEIHKSKKEHEAAERKPGTAQHRTAQRLNWITAIGAVFGANGSVGVILSFVIAKQVMLVSIQ